jgi:hypothetical protein
MAILVLMIIARSPYIIIDLRLPFVYEYSPPVSPPPRGTVFVTASTKMHQQAVPNCKSNSGASFKNTDLSKTLLGRWG